MRFYQIGILFFYCLTYSQNNSPKYALYLDENNKPINYDLYMSKCKSHVLTCDSKIKDSIEIKMVKQSYYFGKLNSIEKNQFLLLLKSRTHLNIDSTKTIIISNIDELNGFDETKVLVHNYRKRRSWLSNKPLTLDRYLSWQKDFDSDQKKCLKRLENENIQTFFIVNKNNGYTYKPKSFNWIESQINIYSLFKFPKHNLDISSVIFLKPSGEYFISRAALPVDFIKNLLRLETWDQPKEDLANSIKYNAPMGLGIFRDILGYYERFPELIEVVKDTSSNFIEAPKTKSIKNVENYYNRPTTCFQ